MTKYISIGCTKNRKFCGIVRSHSLGNELLGKLGFVQFKPDKTTLQIVTVLCQITSVDRRNTVHEDSSFGPVISNQGYIPHLSEIGDYEETIAKPIAQQIDGVTAPLRANPPSGTAIVSLDDESVAEDGSSQKVFNKFASTGSNFIRYGGKLVGEPIKVPFVCKSFNPNDENGWGEARHAGFFGRSGSGKTHAAKIMLGLNLVSTPTMGAFIPDGKGDFLNPSQQDLDLKEFLTKNGRAVETLDIDQLKLEDADHFSDFLFIEGIPKLMLAGNSEKQRELTELTLNRFTDDNDKIIVEGDGAITLQDFIAEFNNRIPLVYSSGIQNKVDQAANKQASNMTRIQSRFNNVLQRFTQGQDINEMVDGVLQNAKIFFLDVKSYEEEINRFILGVIYRRFRRRASYFFKSGKHYSNAIVYVDEANRFIPQSPTDEIKPLAMELIDGIKTTRQYGLAWWFADQRPASISKDAFTQLGTYCFGKGMVAVADTDNMKSIIGSEGLQIYEYAMTTGGKPFVVTGQFVGIGSDDGVTIQIEFFNEWNTLVDENNEDLDCHML